MRVESKNDKINNRYRIEFMGKNMKKLFTVLSGILTAGLALMPQFALAAADALTPITGGGDAVTTINNLIDGAINVITGIAATIAVAYLVYGGFVYITGGAKGAESAKTIIINAIIGLVIIALAYVIINLVVSLL